MKSQTKLFPLLSLAAFCLLGCMKPNGTSPLATTSLALTSPLLCSAIDTNEATGPSPIAVQDEAGTVRYCLEFDGKQNGANIKARYFEVAASGVTRTLQSVPLALSAQKLADGTTAFFALHETLLFKAGTSEAGLCSGPSLPFSCVVQIARTGPKEFLMKLSVQGFEPFNLQRVEEAGAKLAAFTYDGAEHFSDIMDPVQGGIELVGMTVRPSFSPSISSKFSEDQRSIVYSALRVFMDSAWTLAVASCTQTLAGSAFPEPDAVSFNKKFVHLAAGIRLGENVDGLLPIYVYPISGTPEAPGLAYYQNFLSKEKPFPGLSSRRYLYLSLNQQMLGIRSGNPAGGDTEYWAGVIARLVMQNFDFHGLSADQARFLSAYQRCTQSNGEISPELREVFSQEEK